MDTISVMLGLAVGTGIFFILNSIIKIRYFGCGAIASFWFGCVAFTSIVFMFLGGFMMGILKWIIVGGVALSVIGMIGSKIKGS
ncbi:hypothetical protein C4R89_12375 [Clostridioides difficile]|nr:hypothetical protein [Clostridioides difficile]MDB0440328.1 hypothetical protein [Clostridioides difficile]